MNIQARVQQSTYTDRPQLLRVRPIHPNEEAEWDEVMDTHHYLGFNCLVGNSMKYIATLDNRCVALLGWAAAAYKSRHRQQWIGWSPTQRDTRLKYVVNNTRFLILPGIKVRNLASKVLSLNLERLASDWQVVYGHPVVLVETFVDRRFRGSCYRASGWIELGQTRGYGRNGQNYYYHGQPKTLFVRPLRRDAKKLLTATFLSPVLTGVKEKMDLNKVQIEEDGGLLDRLREVTDPRKPRGIRHKQESILAVAICAVLSGARSFVAIGDWAQNMSQEVLARLGCRYHEEQKKYIPPSEPTIRRTLQSVDPDELDRVIYEWLGDKCPSWAIAMDGKTLRGSASKESKPVHIMAALVHGEGVVLNQSQVEDKTNEIKAVKPLLADLELEGKVVTADAMHAQVEHAEYIQQEKGADFVFVVKDNQKTLREDIAALADEDYDDSYTSHDKGHGRIETRKIDISTEINNYIEFPHVEQVFRIKRTITDLDGENKRGETAYGITSLPPEEADPETLLSLARNHWHIENKLHWVRDVTFDEDRSQIRTGSAPRVFATLRNLAISLFRLARLDNIARALRVFSWKPLQCLDFLGL